MRVAAYVAALLTMFAAAGCAHPPARYAGSTHQLVVVGRDAAGRQSAAVYEPGSVVPARHVALAAIVADGKPLDVALDARPRSFVRLRNPEGFVQRGNDLYAPTVVERVNANDTRTTLYAYTRRAGTAAGDLPYVSDGWIAAVDGSWYRLFDVHGTSPQVRVRIETPAGRAWQIGPRNDGTAYIVRRRREVPRPDHPALPALTHETSSGTVLEQRALLFSGVTRFVPQPRGRVLIGFMGSTEGCAARVDEYARLTGAPLRSVVGDRIGWSATTPDGLLVAVGAECDVDTAFAKTVAPDGRVTRTFDLGVRDPTVAAMSADGFLALIHGPRLSVDSAGNPPGVEIYRLTDGARVASLRDVPDQAAALLWR